MNEKKTTSGVALLIGAVVLTAFITLVVCHQLLLSPRDKVIKVLSARLKESERIREMQKVQSVAGTMTASGILKHFPDNVRSAEAWFGHNFMVEGVPIISTEVVPEDVLKKYVGRHVQIKGTWNPGKRWEPTEEEMLSPMPVDPDKDVVIIGDGIVASSIEVVER